MRGCARRLYRAGDLSHWDGFCSVFSHTYWLIRSCITSFSVGLRPHNPTSPSFFNFSGRGGGNNPPCNLSTSPTACCSNMREVPARKRNQAAIALKPSRIVSFILEIKIIELLIRRNTDNVGSCATRTGSRLCPHLVHKACAFYCCDMRQRFQAGNRDSDSQPPRSHRLVPPSSPPRRVAFNAQQHHNDELRRRRRQVW